MITQWEWFLTSVGPIAVYGYDGTIDLRRGTATEWRQWRMQRARFLGTHTAHDWCELLSSTHFTCAGCGEQGVMTKDHIKPVSRGGCDCIQNIQPMCQPCNSKKNRNRVEIAR